MPQKLQDLLASRKFWALVVGSLTLGVAYQFGHMGLETVELAEIGLLSAYIGGTAVEAHGQAIAAAHAAPKE